MLAVGHIAVVGVKSKAANWIHQLKLLDDISVCKWALKNLIEWQFQLLSTSWKTQRVNFEELSQKCCTLVCWICFWRNASVAEAFQFLWYLERKKSVQVQKSSTMIWTKNEHEHLTFVLHLAQRQTLNNKLQFNWKLTTKTKCSTEMCENTFFSLFNLQSFCENEK